jgi:hypothetical protein
MIFSKGQNVELTVGKRFFDSRYKLYKLRKFGYEIFTLKELQANYEDYGWVCAAPEEFTQWQD